MSSAPWLSALTCVIEPARVITDDAALQSHAAQGVLPTCLVSPRTENEIAAVLRFAADHKIVVLPRGGGTAQGVGTPPPPHSIVLSTRRFDKLIHHEPGDMVATAQAGMTLGAFQEALARNGQFLTLDGPADATIGGMMATDRSGARALGYGTARDLVLGMKIVNGDGVFRKCGGRVVKNVSGYDLAKLYIGSLGTLGVITEVTFRLRPFPIARSLWTFDGGTRSEGTAFLRKLAAKNLPLEMLRLQKNKTWTLDVSATGASVELDRIDREIAESIGPKTAMRADTGTPWQTDAVMAPPISGDGATLRFWCVSSKLSALLDAIDPLNPAHLETGVNGGSARLAINADTAKSLAEKLTAMGVNFRWDDISGVQIAEPFGPARPEWALMKKIRAALDPDGIMNTGRFVV